MIRPQPARWFEVLCARDDALSVLESLAATTCVEVEWQAAAQEQETVEANRRLREYAELARRHRAYWPRARMRDASTRKAPAVALADAIARLHAWASEAAPHIAALQASEGEIAELAVVEHLLAALDRSEIDLADLRHAREGITARLVVYPEATMASPVPDVLVRGFAAGHESCALVVGSAAAVAQVEREAGALHGRSVRLPSWLEHDARHSLTLLESRRAAARTEASRERGVLEALAERHEVALALGDVARAAWCFHNAGAIGADGAVLARITGWTCDAPRVAAAIDACALRALIAFPAPARGVHPPLLLRNPWWARPFEFFSRLFGIPAREGVDPSGVLALVSPLLFGYMFGDVGQGLVLIAAGLALRRGAPVWRLLLPGGVASIAFGFLFGSVFGLEGLIAPLWTSPLHDPLAVLAVPVAGGVALLTIGLGLKMLEAYWRGEIGQWLLSNGGFFAVYLGLVAAPFHAAGFAVAIAGALAWLVGHVVRAHALDAAATAAGELLEGTLQMAVNTISFARVGAFALAHAGLSAAIVALAEASGNRVGYAIVLVAGNAAVILLEGLVVGIQTTRLVLFEFFVRFFDSRGREFQPLLPPATVKEGP